MSRPTCTARSLRKPASTFPACGTKPAITSSRCGPARFRRYLLGEPAEAAADRVRAHVAAEREPEIEGPVVIREGGSMPEHLAEQMPHLIAWHFANPPAWNR
jgi:hypothetical protein